jgi:hypothetical protein
MKTAAFLFTLLGSGALTLGLGFAGQPSNPPREAAPPESRAKTTSARPESHAPAKSSPTNGAKKTAKGHSGPKLPQPSQGSSNRPGEKRTNNAQTKGTSGNAAQPHQPGLNKSAGGAKAGPMMNENGNQRRLLVAGLSGTPPPNPVVHARGPGPAIIGGPTPSSARNAAVINGTAMKHKP